MEEACELCPNLAKVSCSCNNSFRFCSDCFLFVHKIIEGNHELISLAKMKQEINEKFNSTTKNLTKLKMFITTKSKQLINMIQLFTKSKL